MDMVPKMISTKDLAYISDMFEWNFVLSKKLNHFSNEVIDPEIKEKLKDSTLLHANICRNLINILKGE